MSFGAVAASAAGAAASSAVGGGILGSVGGGLVSSAVGGLFGKKKKKSKPKDSFQPWALTTSSGTGYGYRDPRTGRLMYGTKLAPELEDIRQFGYGQTIPLAEDYLDKAQLDVPRFDFDYDPQATMDEYYQTGLMSLMPQMTQQTEQMKDRLFGTGRMGARLSSDALGATPQGGTAQMLNPEAYNLNLAQMNALTGLYQQSRGKALQEELQRFNVARNIYGTDVAAQLQELKNIQGAYTGMFGLGKDISGIDKDLLAANLHYGTLSKGMGLGTPKKAMGTSDLIKRGLLTGGMPEKLGQWAEGSINKWLGGSSDPNIVGGGIGGDINLGIDDPNNWLPQASDSSWLPTVGSTPTASSLFGGI